MLQPRLSHPHASERRCFSQLLLFHDECFREILQSKGKGTTFLELSAGALGLHEIPFPPPAEQQAIAAFLDRETGRIDRLVAKKRELIERLKEKRTALISRTVTHGLPPKLQRKRAFPSARLSNPLASTGSAIFRRIGNSGA